MYMLKVWKQRINFFWYLAAPEKGDRLCIHLFGMPFIFYSVLEDLEHHENVAALREEEKKRNNKVNPWIKWKKIKGRRNKSQNIMKTDTFQEERGLYHAGKCKLKKKKDKFIVDLPHY